MRGVILGEIGIGRRDLRREGSRWDQGNRSLARFGEQSGVTQHQFLGHMGAKGCGHLNLLRDELIGNQLAIDGVTEPLLRERRAVGRVIEVAVAAAEC